MIDAYDTSGERTLELTNWKPEFGNDWNERLSQEFSQQYWSDLVAFIERQDLSSVYPRFSLDPDDDQVFKAFRLTSHADTKVVILGQDPYDGEGLAHGLSFSVPCGVPIPDSLRNIYKELQN